MALSLHGSLILSAVNPAKGEEVKGSGARGHLLPRRDRLFHRARSASIASGCSWRWSAGFWSAVCIVISGPFWNRPWPNGGVVAEPPDLVVRLGNLSHVSSRLSNIFTRVQLSVPADMGVPSRTGTRRGRNPPFFSYWIGKFGNAQLGPIYLGYLGVISLITARSPS